MALYSYQGISPEIKDGVFVAPSADVVGKVVLGRDVSIWHGTVIRGDVNWIKIGDETNVQDLSMLHVTKDTALTIGKCVTIAHSVNLHGCIVEDHCLIGIGAIILDGAVVGAGSVVAAGTLIPPGKIIPPNSLVMGSPCVVKKELSDKERELYSVNYKNYKRYKEEYLNPEIVKLIK